MIIKELLGHGLNNIEGSFKEIEMFFLMADSLGRYLKNG